MRDIFFNSPRSVLEMGQGRRYNNIKDENGGVIMLSDVFEKLNIESYAFVGSEILHVGNARLYDGLGENLNVIFMLFPYYLENTAQGLAKFSAVRDYHGFATKVFSEIDAYFEENYPESFHKGYTDHSPFAECRGAASAGLGVIGRNSLLINEKYSSFVCIAEYLTDVSKETLLSEGIPEGDGEVRYCKDCGACTRECPGRCAGGAERFTCVSALNQKKGELTAEEEEIIKSSGYLWGCDVCQLVCPYTKAAIKNNTIETPIEYFKQGSISGDALQILDFPDEEYKKYPFSWRKKTVMMRNAKIFGRESDS